jgi:hypothetical protein
MNRLCNVCFKCPDHCDCPEDDLNECFDTDDTDCEGCLYSRPRIERE